MTDSGHCGAMSAKWLSEDEQRSWRSFVDFSAVLVDLLDRQLQNDSGMPYAYYEILVRLSEAPERTLRMGDLALATRSTPSRISHAVTRLEEAGWVERRTCPSDRRGLLATLTDAGFRELERAAPGHVKAVRSLLVDRLTPEEMAELGRISAKLLEDPPSS